MNFLPHISANVVDGIDGDLEQTDILNTAIEQILNNDFDSNDDEEDNRVADE